MKLVHGFSILGATLAVGCSSAPEVRREVPGGVRYSVTFTPAWTAASHPLEYPMAGLLTGPHFSGVIGATHGGDFSIFKEGGLPSAGLEKLSEQGKHSPLDDEIRMAIQSGRAGELFETDAIKDFSKSATANVTVDDKNPMVALVAMIAPSPDWFAGADVNLMEGGQWVQTREIDVYAWDSGGDSGTTYEASDADNNPKQETMLNGAPHFMKEGQRVPVAHVVFRKLP